MNEEYMRCPHCGRVARHRVVEDRVLAPRHWCMSCFSTWTPHDACRAPGKRQEDASEAA